MKVFSTGKTIQQVSSALRLVREGYREFKWQIFALVALGFLSGILEGIGINAVIPLLSGALGMQNAATDMLSEILKDFFLFLHIPFVPRFILGFIVIMFILKSFVVFYFSYIQIQITSNYEYVMRSTLFKKAVSSSWPRLMRMKLGDLEALLMNDVSISTSLLAKISAMITLITSILMYVVVALSISASVTIVTLLLGVLVFLVLRPLVARVHMRSRERTSVYRDAMHHITEHVIGLKSVKAVGIEEKAAMSGVHHFDLLRKYSHHIQLMQQMAAQTIPPIGILYIAGILALSLKTPFISFAALPAILYLIYRIFSYLQQMQNNVQSISEYLPYLERVVQYENSANESVLRDSGTHPFSFTNALAFQNISFSYESSRSVLKDMSFSIRKGSMTGIVGPSGAGKTTCVDLILRLLEPSAGHITLDGVNIAEIDDAQWRKKVAYVSQDFFIIHGTIRDNIRFYDDSITDDDVWSAAEAAHIASFIRESPDGLDTHVGDRGILLSAGQRQRIVIARALARKPEILILDEATSALDNESEAHIKRVIEELKGKVTIIAIAHRLSTIMDSDSLFVLKEGEIAETGAPDVLLRDTNSYFYKVYTISQ